MKKNFADILTIVAIGATLGGALLIHWLYAIGVTGVNLYAAAVGVIFAVGAIDIFARNFEIKAEEEETEEIEEEAE